MDVDAHVLSTPALLDVNGDGKPELILTVSYFFDADEYHATPQKFSQLPEGVEIDKYVAGQLLENEGSDQGR